MKANVKNLMMVLLLVSVPVGCGKKDSSVSEARKQTASDYVTVFKGNAALTTRGKNRKSYLGVMDVGKEMIEEQKIKGDVVSEKDNGPETAPVAATGLETVTKTVAEDAKPSMEKRVPTEYIAQNNEAAIVNNMTPEIMENKDVMLDSIVLAKGVSQRKPILPGTRFSAAEGEEIYVILDVKNATEEVTEVTVSWKMPGCEKEIDPTTLVAKADNVWRTWSSIRSDREPGLWEAVVRNANGYVIARAPFEILQ